MTQENKENPTVQTSSTVLGTSYRIQTDEDLYFKLSICPFFQTYRERQKGGIEAILLPLFRYYHIRRMDSTHLSFSKWLIILNEFICKYSEEPDKIYKTCYRYLLNFYAVFHPSKRFETLLSFFPYFFEDQFVGCTETVVRTPRGVRLYCYSFSDTGVTVDDLNLYGFKLQTAARFFHIQTGEKPESLCLFYPATRWNIYYQYQEDEKIEEHLNDRRKIRTYGQHCSSCRNKNCRPLIDKKDEYGWGLLTRK